MNLASPQVFMDSVDRLQKIAIHEEGASSPTGEGEIVTCSRQPPLMHGTSLVRPHVVQDQAQKCPRCDSRHTKFCYYNNYSLSQPRHFCKTCRRYWTKGGKLRNIPIGGGCRKNKKATNKKSRSSSISLSYDNDYVNKLLINTQNFSEPPLPLLSSTNLHLSLHDQTQLSHLNSLLGSQVTTSGHNFNIYESRPIDFVGGKLVAQSFDGFNSSSFGIPLDRNGQRLMLPYDYDHQEQNGAIDLKPISLGNLNSIMVPSWITTTHGMINGYNES